MQEVGTHETREQRPVEVDAARVERTLLSAAFEVDLASDLASTILAEGRRVASFSDVCVRYPCRGCRILAFLQGVGGDAASTISFAMLRARLLMAGNFDRDCRTAKPVAFPRDFVFARFSKIFACQQLFAELVMLASFKSCPPASWHGTVAKNPA